MADGTVAWVFPGQGSQKVGMGMHLVSADPELAAAMASFDEAAGFPLTALIADGPEDDLTLTPNQQPAVVAASLIYLMALGKAGALPRPEFVAGHSLGEYSAMVAAGALDARDAIRLVRRRGESMQAHGAGAMAAVMGMDPAAVTEIAAAAGAEVANYNAPDQTTISGTAEAVRAAMDLAKERGAKRAVLLPVSAAFHSSLMQPVVDEMRALLAETPFAPARVPLVADVDARAITHPDDLRQELVDHICASVRWTDAVAAMTGAGVATFYEIGPGKVLSGLIARTARDATTITAESLLPA